MNVFIICIYIGSGVKKDFIIGYWLKAKINTVRPQYFWENCIKIKYGTFKVLTTRANYNHKTENIFVI